MEKQRTYCTRLTEINIFFAKVINLRYLRIIREAVKVSGVLKMASCRTSFSELMVFISE
jgi:hypothetical protein